MMASVWPASTFTEKLIPEHPKNWLILFEVYVILFCPEINVPLSGKPIVESTLITVSPIKTGSRALE